MANDKVSAETRRKYLDRNYSLQVRKQVLYSIGLLALIGQAVWVGTIIVNGGGYNPGNYSITLPLLALAIITVVLTAQNLIKTAGSLLCAAVLGGVTYGIYYFGATSPIAILYLATVIFAGVLVGPAAVIVFGFLGTLAELSVGLDKIANYEGTPDPGLAIGIAVIALVLVTSSAVLYIFSATLSRIAESARLQAEELQQANARLLTRNEQSLETTRQINDLSEMLAHISSQQNSSTTEQVKLVNEVASTTMELDAAARRIANSALTVSTMAEKALKSAESGQFAAQDGVLAIASLRTRVENITQSVRYLNTQIERISEVTDIIGEIADETNLLALNATIEAAGAREYGRRFAAVAEEVQRLSRRTTAAVEQIQEVVNEIMQASNKSLETTEEGMRQAQQGTDLVERISHANTEIIDLVNQTAEMATNIATSTQQQRTASEQIVHNIHEITKSSSELAQVGEQVTTIVAMLESTSSRLMQEEPAAPEPEPAPPEELDELELLLRDENPLSSTPRS